MEANEAVERMKDDPTYVMSEINANPIWKKAFELSERENPTAPAGWGKYIPKVQ